MIASFFSMIRWVNLLYLFLTLCGLRFLLINPLFELAGYTPTLSNASFIMLTLSIMLIAAAGYIVNDYFDVEADTINKPDKVYIGKTISPQQAMQFYHICNTSGILLGFYLAWLAGNIKLVFIHLFPAAALWFYATHFKRKPFIGNLLVSVLVALSVFSIILFDTQTRAFAALKMRELLKTGFEALTGYIVAAPELNGFANKELFETIVLIVAGYAAFAFLLNLVRELVKDLEDAEGDEEAGYRTLPLVAGFSFTKLLAAAIVLLTIRFIANFQIGQALAGQIWVAVFTLLLIQLPLLYVVYKLWRAKEKATFTQISRVIKALMLLGLAYLPYLRASITYTPQQTTLPPGIESISIDVDTTQTEQPDTTAGFVRPDTTQITIDPNMPDETVQPITPDTETDLPKSLQPEKPKNNNAIDDELLK